MQVAGAAASSSSSAPAPVAPAAVPIVGLALPERRDDEIPAGCSLSMHINMNRSDEWRAYLPPGQKHMGRHSCSAVFGGPRAGRTEAQARLICLTFLLDWEKTQRSGDGGSGAA